MCSFPKDDGAPCGFTYKEDSGFSTSSPGAPLKLGESMKDVLSTGRKRAALEAPIEEGTICEWATLKYAGGGVKPIVGCAGNFASDRHHGPNKSTLENTPGINLHRICDHCHNRWHTANDQYYGKERPANGADWLPINEPYNEHDGQTLADPAEINAHEIWWSTPKDLRGEYRSWEIINSS